MKFTSLAIALLPLAAQAFLVPDPSMLEDAKHIFGNAVQEVKDGVKHGIAKVTKTEELVSISQDHKSAYMKFSCPGCFGEGESHADDAFYMSLRIHEDHGRHAAPYLTINEKVIPYPRHHRGDASSIVFDAQKVPVDGEDVMKEPPVKISAKVTFVKPGRRHHDKGHKAKSKKEPRKPKPAHLIVEVWRVAGTNVNVAPLRITYSHCKKNPQLLALERVSENEVPAVHDGNSKADFKKEIISLKKELKECTNLKCVFTALITYAKKTGQTVRLWIVRVRPGVKNHDGESGQEASSASAKPPCRKPWKWPHPSYKPDGEEGEHPHGHHKRPKMLRVLCVLKKTFFGAALVFFMAAVFGLVFKITRAFVMRARGYNRLNGHIVLIREEPMVVEDEKENLLRDEKMEIGEAYHDELEK